jgi:hypothetical protein
MKFTDEEINAGAKYLRDTTQKGKNLNPWEMTAKSSKKKWLVLAEGVLTAAARARTSQDTGEPTNV